MRRLKGGVSEVLRCSGTGVGGGRGGGGVEKEGGGVKTRGSQMCREAGMGERVFTYGAGEGCGEGFWLPWSS